MRDNAAVIVALCSIGVAKGNAALWGGVMGRRYRAALWDDVRGRCRDCGMRMF